MMNKKYFSTIVLCFTLLFQTGTYAEDSQPLSAEATTTKIFSDVDIGSNYFVQLSYLKDKKIIKGYEDGSFGVKKFINRAEAAVTINKALMNFEILESAKKKTAEEFSDIPKDFWAIDAIHGLSELGIIEGYKKKENQIFRAEKTINLAEAVKMIIGIEMLRDSKLSLPADSKSSFKDMTGTEWFAPYIELAKTKTLLSYTTKMLIHPDDEMTRGMFMDLIYRTIITREVGHFFGRGSFYSDFFEGRGTSNDEIYTQNGYTAAHKTLPFNTKIHVTYLRNGQSVDVRVNDRGPFTPSFDLDITSKAFKEIADISEGVIPIEFSIINNDRKE